jgi:hypothetical protein
MQEAGSRTHDSAFCPLRSSTRNAIALGYYSTRASCSDRGLRVPVSSSAVFTSLKKNTVQTKDSPSHQTYDTCMEY